MALSFARKRPSDKSLVKKSKSNVSRSSVKGGGNNIVSRIKAIIQVANQKLANHIDDYEIITDSERLRQYINEARMNDILALDTETTGLNPITDKIVGLCLYTPGQKACYIPINHKSYITLQRIENQLSETEVAKELELFDGKYVFHNAKFDIRVCRHSLGVSLEPYWDTLLASKCINEKGSHALKDLHLAMCNSKDTESLTFDSLFNGVTFDNIPISTAVLYAAGDPLKTFELYEKQKEMFESGEYDGPYNVFRHIEMPLITTVCDMEDRGICLDNDVVKYLQDKYHKIHNDRLNDVNKALSMYDELVNNYITSHPGTKIKLPVNVNSPQQLAILFYDILKLESPDRKSPRGTGSDILNEFAKGNHKNLCEAILALRNVEKLLSTYIDKIPSVVLDDGKVHCSYNQYGADTGRFSSSEPNMQNIPSHNKEIRKMFRAEEGYVLLGADFSQQEPMTTSYLSNDEKMQQAFRDGKDIYSTVAALSFGKTYEECLEFNSDGTTNSAGKERRTQAKSIVLGILYGRSIPSIAEQLDCSIKKAQEIYDKVLASFTGLANFIEQSETQARENGYVETAWGRRRHIPDMQLPKYEFSYISNKGHYDPLAFDTTSVEVEPKLVEKYTRAMDKARYAKDRSNVMYEARQEGIKIKDNTFKIAEAERQCVNSRVQGSAADITKLAMLAINNDSKMKELDFHLLIQVHDEVIGECPRENAKEAAERLSYLMRTAPTELIDLPFRCDCSVTTNWYGEEIKL
jgi:DNA polymerase I-like protein with 3'-5' exonuclease and polymerase domains